MKVAGIECFMEWLVFVFCVTRFGETARREGDYEKRGVKRVYKID